MDSAKLLLCAASAAAIDICAMALMLTSYREKSSGKKRWSKTAADMELADQNSVYPLECDEILIGRHASADIRLADMSVSRYHAILNVVEGGKWTITDMGSKSGVYVNGTLTKHKRLRENDIVTIGNRRLIFRKRRGKR
ncbi:MAG: FHA domain-containing protein [Ruminococcus sp.]|nr:FHA domain-containing protein [Ruminococcus sp.]